MEQILTLRIQERDSLLARLRAALEADPRVAAAWLHGSLGRGEADAWSDLDLWVVTDGGDDLRNVFVRNALFTEEAPQNGPVGGTYQMSAHDAPTGPHLVDWYFQPLRFASASVGRLVLFERADFPATPDTAPPNPGFSGTSEEDRANRAALFWAMVLVQAKYVARKPVEDGMGFEGFLLSLLNGVAGTDEQETPGLRLATEKIARLRALATRMTKAAPEFAGPHEAVARFLRTVEAAV